MAEKPSNGRLRRLLGGLVSLGLALILMAVIYLAAILLKTPEAEKESAWVVEEEQAPVSRMQPATMSDAKALSELFGAPLPVLPGYPQSGTGENAAHDGQLARVATLHYEGFTVTAVRPASAAPLLLHGELAVRLRSDLTVMNLPAVLASRGNAYCAYFSSEAAAYAVYAPEVAEEAFLALLSRLTAAQ